MLKYLTFFICASAFGQVYGGYSGSFIPTQNNPFGATCTTNTAPAYLYQGTIYTCQGGAYAAVSSSGSASFPNCTGAGIVKSPGGTASCATAGTDYQSPIAVNTYDAYGAASAAINALNASNLSGLASPSTALANLGGITSAQASALTSMLPSIIGLAAPNYAYIFSDPDTSSTGQYINARAPGTNILSSYQQGVGAMPGLAPMIAGLPSATSTLFSSSSIGTAGGSSVQDNTGATAMTYYGVASPNISCTGSVVDYAMFTKTSTTTPYPGYEFGFRCTTTSTYPVLYAKLQGATAGNYIDVQGIVQFPYRVARGFAMFYAGTKLASGFSLAYTDSGGDLTYDTLTINSDTMGSDTATNTGSLVFGGRGGGSTSQSVGKYLDGWLSNWATHLISVPFSAVASSLKSSYVGFQPPVTKNAVAKPVIWVDDQTTDFDGISALRVLIALHKRGEANLLAVVISGSNPYSASVVAEILRREGLSSIPIGAYQGNDRATTSSWASGTYTAFGLTTTRASYSSPQTVLCNAFQNYTGTAKISYLETGPEQETAAFMAGTCGGGKTGIQLLTAQADRMVIMGGYYANGSEYNFTQSPTSANYVFLNNPIPIYDVSNETANSVNVAVPGNALLDPARKAFELYSVAGSGNITRGTTWDVIAAFSAVRTSTPLLTLGKTNATNSINASTGANTWSATTGNHNAYTVPNAANLLVALETLIGETSSALIN